MQISKWLLSPPIMNDIFFSQKNIYNLRKFQELSTSTKNTVNFGTETIACRDPQLWNLFPDNIKSEPTFELLKKKIRKWQCEPCPCRMCKTYLQHYRLYQLIKILASILPIVSTNLFYRTLKHCVVGLRVDFDWLFILCTV